MSSASSSSSRVGCLRRRTLPAPSNHRHLRRIGSRDGQSECCSSALDAADRNNTCTATRTLRSCYARGYSRNSMAYDAQRIESDRLLQTLKQTAFRTDRLVGASTLTSPPAGGRRIRFLRALSGSKGTRGKSSLARKDERRALRSVVGAALFAAKGDDG
uniref:Uncharacterized protein n=1 Tax=Plectus sambesii TaxID=2011161 RepID=A0A914VRY6_9BILA